MNTTLWASPAHSDAGFARIVDEVTRRGSLTGAAGTVAPLSATPCGRQPVNSDTKGGAWTFADA